MRPERAELYFQQGCSDKVYHLQLEGAQDQWAVQAQVEAHGRYPDGEIWYDTRIASSYQGGKNEV